MNFVDILFCFVLETADSEGVVKNQKPSPSVVSDAHTTTLSEFVGSEGDFGLVDYLHDIYLVEILSVSHASCECNVVYFKGWGWDAALSFVKETGKATSIVPFASFLKIVQKPIVMSRGRISLQDDDREDYFTMRSSANSCYM